MKSGASKPGNRLNDVVPNLPREQRNATWTSASSCNSTAKSGGSRHGSMLKMRRSIPDARPNSSASHNSETTCPGAWPSNARRLSAGAATSSRLRATPKPVQKPASVHLREQRSRNERSAARGNDWRTPAGNRDTDRPRDDRPGNDRDNDDRRNADRGEATRDHRNDSSRDASREQLSRDQQRRLIDQQRSQASNWQRNETDSPFPDRTTLTRTGAPAAPFAIPLPAGLLPALAGPAGTLECTSP